MFTIDYKSRVPIYRQLVDRVEYLAARGLLSPGSQLPSVRALAVELSINPNTIELVRRFFREHGREEYTSLEVAQAVELSSVTARKYLNYLISQQELKATVDYMTGGRPCIRYRYVSRSLGDRKRRSACPVK